MKCPDCQFINPQGMKFCVECGARLEIICSECSFSNAPTHKFCGECGSDLRTSAEPVLPEPEESPPDNASPAYKSIESERKHVTALFSDLSGYTAMTEKLDPEEVKDITSRIFDEISKIISKYEGFIEKFAGDAIMALFGAETVHEDDPVRAIRAAREIHSLVNSLSPKYEEIIEQPLSMHTGINTGLVVTGEVDLDKGTHGVAGETINVAARLSSLGNADEILVGSDTFKQAEGYFDFDELELAQIKGKSEPVRVYKVLALKEQPIKIHRLHGLRSDLIGRKVEMNLLAEAVQKLEEGNGAVFSISGTAGTGKSRIVRDFRDTLDLQKIQWLEGHAYPYTQNIPYYPLINLLSRALQIEEGDLPEKVREKVKSGISGLIGEHAECIPYIGSLFSLSYPEIDEVSPEFWKDQLQKSIQMVLSALAQQAPTVIRLEDLHWADPSFLELIRLLLTDFREPVLFLCIYRPIISLFTSHQISSMANPYNEIRLQDLSPSESQVMVESLLKTDVIPSDLQRFVQDKIEGNPFYIEEVINSLIESETLVRDNSNWKVTKPIGEADISSKIHGIIAGRLDRLEKETKRILQEASVIGRVFFYEILKKVTALKSSVDQRISRLERLDLIKLRSLKPDLEYLFKHPLTQEVVYNSLLKKERQEIHEQIALVIEQLFESRLQEFYETLAFHFTRGQSVLKAVHYLMKSGEKSLRRYAVEESHQYYKEAFTLLSNRLGKSKEEEGFLIDLLIKWALVFYYRGDFLGLTDLLGAYKDLAESTDDKARLGMFYGWFGFAWHCRGKTKDSYQYLCKALEIGEEIEDQQVIGYACSWLTWTCADMGLLNEAIVFGERAQEISRFLETDQYLYFKSLGGLLRTYSNRGELKKALEAGEALLDYGRKHSNIRSLVMGHAFVGVSYVMDADLSKAMECFEKADQIPADPFYSQFGKLGFGIGYFLGGQLQEAEDAFHEVMKFSKKFGAESIGIIAEPFLGAIWIAKGQMSQGLKVLEEFQRVYVENEKKYHYAFSEYLLGRIYLQIVQGEGQISLSTMARNIGFLIRNVPFASKKAEVHFKKAIEAAKEIGAKGILGQAYLNLGLLNGLKERSDRAKEYISEAIAIFEQCEAEVILKQAKEALASLE